MSESWGGDCPAFQRNLEYGWGRFLRVIQLALLALMSLRPRPEVTGGAMDKDSDDHTNNDIIMMIISSSSISSINNRVMIVILIVILIIVMIIVNIV